MTNPIDKEEILYAFAVEERHDRATLERYLRAYPELADDLIDLTSELRLGGTIDPASTESIPSSEVAWQAFLASDPRATRSKEVVDPFVAFKGQAFVKLAAAMDVPRSFLTPFRDGLVAAASIPRRFVARLAAAMSTSAESLERFLANPRPSAVARAFKSEAKPSHQGQKSFREMVENTPMSDEQRRVLLEDSDEDGLV